MDILNYQLPAITSLNLALTRMSGESRSLSVKAGGYRILAGVAQMVTNVVLLVFRLIAGGVGYGWLWGRDHVREREWLELKNVVIDGAAGVRHILWGVFGEVLFGGICGPSYMKRYAELPSGLPSDPEKRFVVMETSAVEAEITPLQHFFGQSASSAAG